jgi:Zn2+/Cd2+-exporting ATPase
VTTCTVCELHAESTFKIEGMDCREEVALLERRFKNLPGIESFSADVIGQRLHVAYDAAKLSTSGIAGAVADTGMQAWLEHEEAVAIGPRATFLRQALVSTSGVALTTGLLLDWVGAAPALAAVLFGLAIATAASLT